MEENCAFQMELREAEIRICGYVQKHNMILFTQGPQPKQVEETPIPKTRKRKCNLHSLKTPFRLAHLSLYTFVDNQFLNEKLKMKQTKSEINTVWE